jgi:hypothetical protein
VPGVHRPPLKVHGFGLEGEAATEEVLLLAARERPASVEQIMAGHRTQVGGGRAGGGALWWPALPRSMRPRRRAASCCPPPPPTTMPHTPPPPQSLVTLAALSESLDFVADRIQQAVASASGLAPAAGGQQHPGRASGRSPRLRPSPHRRAGAGVSPGRGRSAGAGAGSASLLDTLAVTADR